MHTDRARLLKQVKGIGITAPDLLLPSLGMCTLHCSLTLPTLVLESPTTATIATIETLRTVGADAFGANRALEDHSCSIYCCYMGIRGSVRIEQPLAVS